MENTKEMLVSFSPEKRRLLELEETGEYVFHGSGENNPLLEPRQAYDYQDGVQEKDGEPAVFASDSADYAILMAIINRKNCPKGHHSGAGTKTGEDGKAKIKFRAGNKTLAQLGDGASGFVFVFNKADFQERNRGGAEYVRYETISPIETVCVYKQDLPENIEVFNEE